MKKQIHIVVLLGFLGGLIAPACGFVWGGNYSVIEICTTQGIEKRIVQGEQTPERQHLHEQCQFCFFHANLKGAITEINDFEALFVVQEKVKFHLYEIIHASRLITNNAARAPPTFI